MKKTISLLFIIIISFFANAQNEFITLWKPGTSQQIHFPGRGTNFNVSWEEVGYAQHNGILNNVTSTREFILNFGTPMNPVAGNATYRVKVSNGEGNFNQIRFFDSTITPLYNSADMNKILEVAQWGNIQWISFESAFVLCNNMNVTATDSPNLSLVTSTQDMFYICSSLVGNSSFNNWDTSSITNMNSMFSAAPLFNASIGNWNVSNVVDFYAMFDAASSFN